MNATHRTLERNAALALVTALLLAVGALPARPAAVLGMVATPVTVSAPVLRYRAGATLVPGRYPVQVRWSVTGVTPAARFQVQASIDGGAWESVASPTVASADTTVASGHAYVFRVRGLDAALVPGEWASGATQTVAGYSEASPKFTWTGTWGPHGNPRHWGGATRATGVAGRSATFSFTGWSAAIVAPMGPTRGSAKIYVDGVYRLTVSLYRSSNAYRRIVYEVRWAEPGPHTVQVVVKGTAGHPRVDVDGAVVLQ